DDPEGDVELGFTNVQPPGEASSTGSGNRAAGSRDRRARAGATGTEGSRPGALRHPDRRLLSPERVGRSGAISRLAAALRQGGPAARIDPAGAPLRHSPSRGRTQAFARAPLGCARLQ